MKTLILENKEKRSSAFGMHSDFGWGNGYVLLPVGHKWHGLPADKIPATTTAESGIHFAELVDEARMKAINAHHGKNTIAKEDIGTWMIGFNTLSYDDTIERWPKVSVQREADLIKEQAERVDINK